ncbi:DUF6612 family protein [Geosporobacter ferrireducens]|uniref:DUF4412 domain-containing protein n=1 Tax=Geosporobacter ferrireducens TaxID=1424294 RepID=A0A1D8GIX5_9FIRM|nr:DUF6612 family protein [Geosporobacter ferrireducens]AOT70848.1 hypothetical protein Gferi_15570 [Geosporobacter ferrireducens]
MKNKKVVLLLAMMMVLSVTSVAMAQTEAANLTREGLSAMEMMQLASEKMDAFDTYKYNGVLNMEMKMDVPGEEKQEMKMEIVQEGVFKKPQQVYGKTTGKILNMELPGGDRTTEVYMNDNTMYIRDGQEEQWIKMDMDPLLKEIQKLTGSQEMGGAVMSKEQMAALGMYATYGQDVVKDGKTYYVINVNMDQEAFKKMYQEVMEKIMPQFAEMAVKEGEEQPQVDPEVIKKQIVEMISMMEMEMEYSMYIDKETKLFEDMKIKQTLQMNMGEMKSHTSSEGTYKYYDFNGEVTFPEIKPEDIKEMNKME